MSSPRVNNIIAMGFMLAYLCVVLIGIDRSTVGEGALLHVCRVRGIENEIGTCKVLEKKKIIINVTQTHTAHMNISNNKT